MKTKKMFLLFLVIFSVLSYCNPSALFKGYVFDRKSKYPVSNAEIECGGKLTFTDGKGYFEFRNLIIGNLIIRIKAPDFQDYNDIVKISHGTNSQNFFMEQRPVMVKARGIVENEDTGLGVSNINVSFDNIMSQTDEYGEFFVNDLTPGKYIVKIQHPDYEKYLEEVNVNEANVNNFKFFLKPLVRYGKVIGEIRNIEGDLVMDAQVVIDSNQPVNVSGGKYVFEDIVRGKHRLVIYSDSYEPYEEYIIVEESSKVRTILKKDPDFRFGEFEKKKEQDKSVKNITNSVKGSLEGLVRDAGTFRFISGVTLTIGDKYTVSGNDGSYFFHDLEPGEHIMSIISSEYGVYNADIVIKPGAGIFNISLKKDERDSLIFGKIWDRKTQKPVIGAKVVIGNTQINTDEKGFYQAKVDLDDYVEVKVYIGHIMFFRKIVYINSNKVKNDIFLEVE